MQLHSVLDDDSLMQLTATGMGSVPAAAGSMTEPATAVTETGGQVTGAASAGCLQAQQLLQLVWADSSAVPRHPHS